MSDETYLGDGLYASFDGFMITLRAPRTGGDHWVGLEPEVYCALLEFVERLKARQDASPMADNPWKMGKNPKKILD